MLNNRNLFQRKLVYCGKFTLQLVVTRHVIIYNLQKGSNSNSIEVRIYDENECLGISRFLPIFCLQSSALDHSATAPLPKCITTLNISVWDNRNLILMERRHSKFKAVLIQTAIPKAKVFFLF